MTLRARQILQVLAAAISAIISSDKRTSWNFIILRYIRYSEHFNTEWNTFNAVWWHNQSKAFSRVGVKIWNGVPTRLKKVSRNCFKETIRTQLIEILETENSYADIDTLINKMEN